MYSEDAEKDQHLKAALQYVILVTQLPYFMKKDYPKFFERVYEGLSHEPFNTSLDSVGDVSVNDVVFTNQVECRDERNMSKKNKKQQSALISFFLRQPPSRLSHVIEGYSYPLSLLKISFSLSAFLP